MSSSAQLSSNRTLPQPTLAGCFINRPERSQRFVPVWRAFAIARYLCTTVCARLTVHLANPDRRTPLVIRERPRLRNRT